MENPARNRPWYVAIMIPTGIGLNLALGVLVTALKVPVFLDAIGTLVFTMVVGLVRNSL